MLRSVILEGDTTNHGGTVMEGRDNMTLDGRRIAELGHRVNCPRCRGVFPIIEGVPHHTLFGVGTAVEGMLTACGATLIASQKRMRIEYPLQASAPEGTASPLTVAETGPSSPLTAPPTVESPFDEAVQMVDELSGQALAGVPYRFELADGTVMRGVTDMHGRTMRVATKGAMPLALYLDHSSEQDEADHG